MEEERRWRAGEQIARERAAQRQASAPPSATLNPPSSPSAPVAEPEETLAAQKESAVTRFWSHVARLFG